MTFRTFGISGFRDFVFLLTNARFNFPWTLREIVLHPWEVSGVYGVLCVTACDWRDQV